MPAKTVRLDSTPGNTASPKRMYRPCKKHPGAKAYPNGLCSVCSNESRLRYKQKFTPAEWLEKTRKWDRDAYRNPDSKTREFRVNYRKNRRFDDPEGYLLCQVKAGARKRGLEFNLDRNDIKIPDVCPVFGFPLEFTLRERTPNTPSVDRIDSSRGYVSGNVIVVSWKANEIKMASSPDDLIKVGNFYKSLEES
jgi:hypothetical protein